jgi:UDPglucose--hexose-1-phosphate uridylyltransferase
MNQLRLDPLSGRWVVVSTGRSERPYSFVTRTPSSADSLGRPCPFCPGNEEDTPPALETYGPTGRWLVRVVPNLYPAFEGDEPFVVANRGPVFTQATAGGIHEILIFSPEHDATLGQLGQEQVELIMAALRDRLEEHSQQPNLRYTQAIVNSGREAGASLEHPHGQLLGMSFIPRELAEEQARFARFAGSCLLCTTLEAEEDSGQRVIYANDHVVVVCPFWSAVPYEMLVIPREHTPHLHKSPTEDLIAVGEGLRRTLAQLAETIGDVAYNVVFHSAPYRVGEPFHWHAHVWPKATTTAGFELGTGVAINVVSPEEAAETLKVSVLAA